MFNIKVNINILAIINNTASTLAIVNDKAGTTRNLNYIIGGLIALIIVLIASTLFSKK